jgi:hypothetical protein
MKATAMTSRGPNAVRGLARRLRRFPWPGVSMAATGAATGAAGARWPWRPTALFAVTVTAAISVALLPAAVARRLRR